MKEKSSTAYLFECYIWLVNTLARGPISRADLDRKWAHSSVNEYKQDSLPESNFHRWRRTVEQIFDITITCNSNNEYYIAEMDKSRDADLHNRLLTIMGVNSLLKDSKNLRDKILFEPVPSGDTFLAPIIEALRDEYAIQITHQGFGKAYPSTYLVEPYCLKMFKQRWYMLAYSPGTDDMRVYGLDRILAIEPSTEKYKIPKDFDAERYFKNTYGVSFADDQPEEVKVKISAYQANFLRSLPIHTSQEEIECNDEFSIFRYFVVPTFEFMQELRKYGSELEVLSPQSLRDEFIDEAGSLYSKYYGEEEQA